MIEAPEAAILASQLDKTVKGKTITVAITGFTPHKFMFHAGNPDLYEGMLAGKTVTGAQVLAGMVRIEAGDTKIVFTDGVNLSYFEPGAKLPSKHQFLLGFDDESCLIASIRMYGGVMVFRGETFEGGLAPYYESARDKPQVLSEDFTEEYFMGLINGETEQKKSAKAFLATGQTIPGLGNGVLQDILYNSAIHPKAKVAGISPERRKKLYDSVRSTLSAMTAAGGRDSETDIFGNSGRYKPFLSKDTMGESCTRCGDIIMKENYLGGAIYYCPGCQK